MTSLGFPAILVIVAGLAPRHVSPAAMESTMQSTEQTPSAKPEAQAPADKPAPKPKAPKPADNYQAKPATNWWQDKQAVEREGKVPIVKAIEPLAKSNDPGVQLQAASTLLRLGVDSKGRNLGSKTINALKHTKADAIAEIRQAAYVKWHGKTEDTEEE